MTANQHKNNIALAEEYYVAMSEKNVAEIEKLLHPNVVLLSPLGQTTGKKAVLESAKQFMDFFSKLTVRAKFGSADQAVIVYDVELPAPIGKVRTASLVGIEDGLITSTELFFDTQPFKNSV